MKRVISSCLSTLLVFFPLASNAEAIKKATKSQGDANQNQGMPQPKNIDKAYGKEGTLNESKSALISVDPLALQNYSQSSNNFDFSAYDKVSLKSVILETLSQSNDLRSANEKVIQTELSYKEAYAGYLPTVDFQYSVKRTHNAITGDDTIDTLEHQNFNDESYKFTLRQSLYTGGATEFKIKSLKSKVEEAKRKYKIVLEEEIQKAIKAYFGVLFNHKSVIINERNMEKLNKILEITQIKYDSGALSIGDLSAVKANIANASGKLIRVKSELADAIDFYVYTVGEDFRQTAPFEETFPLNLTTLDALFEDIIENNLNLINYRLNIQSTKDKLLNMKATFKPKVDLEVNYKNVLDKEGFTANEESYDGKVTLSYNLYNGGKDTIATMTVFSSLQELNFRYKEEVKKIKWETTKLYNSIKSLQETLLNTKKEVAASSEMVNSYWEGFQLGEQDLQVLLQGQRQLNGAELDLVKYEQDHITNIFKLLTSEGKLSQYFNIDENHPDFIDFSNTTAIKQAPIIDLSVDKNKTNEKNDSNSTDLNATKEEELDLNSSINEIQTISDLNQTIDEYLDVVKEANYDNIINFKDKFLEADDESYTVMVSSFTNHYDAYGFAKKNRILDQSFSYEYFNKNGDFDTKDSKTKVINVKTNIAYGIYTTQDEAELAIGNLFDKGEKGFTIVKIKEIKELYNSYISGLEAKVDPFIIKPKVIKTFMTNQEFKNKFLLAPKDYYSINVVSVPQMEQAANLIKQENIEKDSFVFKYGRNGMWVKIMFGVFSSYDQAVAELSKHPELIKKYRPVIEKIGQKQDTYNQYKEFNPTPQWYLDEQKEKRESKVTPKVNKEKTNAKEEKKEEKKIVVADDTKELLNDEALNKNILKPEIKIEDENVLPTFESVSVMPPESQKTEENNDLIMEESNEKELKKFDSNQELVPQNQTQETNRLEKSLAEVPETLETNQPQAKAPLEIKDEEIKSSEPNLESIVEPIIEPSTPAETTIPLVAVVPDIKVEIPTATISSASKLLDAPKDAYTIALGAISDNEKDRFIKEYLAGKQIATASSDGTTKIYYGVFENIQAARVAKFKLDPKLIDGIKLYKIGRINPNILSSLKDETIDQGVNEIPSIQNEVINEATNEVITKQPDAIKTTQTKEPSNSVEKVEELQTTPDILEVSPQIDEKDKALEDEKNTEATTLNTVQTQADDIAIVSVPEIIVEQSPVEEPVVTTIAPEESQMIEKTSNGEVPIIATISSTSKLLDAPKDAYTIALGAISDNEKDRFIKEYLAGKQIATASSDGTTKIYYGVFENIQAARVAKFKLDPKLIDGIKLYKIGRINPNILSSLKDETIDQGVNEIPSIQNEVINEATNEVITKQPDAIKTTQTKEPSNSVEKVEELQTTPDILEVSPQIDEKDKTLEDQKDTRARSFDKSQYDSFQDAFLNAPKEYYTIELGNVVDNEKDKFINRYILDDQYAQISQKGKTKIYYGLFETLQDAKAQQKNLHPKLASKVKIYQIGTMK